MEIFVKITNSSITVPDMEGHSSSSGAVIEFSGIVRSNEAGQKIGALIYEAYQPMAENEIRRLLSEIALEHCCHRACVVHRIGVVKVGEAAIYLRIEAQHRAEAFAMAMAFMDRMKQDVPIWKSGVLP